MSKLSPEQAWQHVKALWPDAEYIRKGCQKLSTDGVYRGRDIDSFIPLHHCEIDWPDGMTRYPPPEPQHREPWQDDVGKMVEVRDRKEQPWKKQMLLAILPSKCEYRYIADTTRDDTEPTFDYFIESRIAVDDAQTEDKSSAIK